MSNDEPRTTLDNGKHRLEVGVRRRFPVGVLTGLKLLFQIQQFSRYRLLHFIHTACHAPRAPQTSGVASSHHRRKTLDETDRFPGKTKGTAPRESGRVNEWGSLSIRAKRVRFLSWKEHCFTIELRMNCMPPEVVEEIRSLPGNDVLLRSRDEA